jgi:N-acetylglutamate synthase-like GNAT family acetyltransferase
MGPTAKRSVAIRAAHLDDAAGIADLLRRSITELCVIDHENNPAWLQPWLANKTPENVASWIANPANHMFVALRDGRIAAVGSITEAGYIGLNYVAPDARFAGLSRMMLTHLEDQARRFGLSRVFLTSTGTARRFYLAAGYRLRPGEDATGDPSSLPMEKLW